MILGFPSNDFGGQEPGSSEQIAQFASARRGEVPLFEKVKTKGADKSPVNAFLTAKNGEPKWNFHKTWGKGGQVIAAYPSSVTPESAELRKALDDARARSAQRAAWTQLGIDRSISIVPGVDIDSSSDAFLSLELSAAGLDRRGATRRRPDRRAALAARRRRS